MGGEEGVNIGELAVAKVRVGGLSRGIGGCRRGGSSVWI